MQDNVYKKCVTYVKIKDAGISDLKKLLHLVYVKFHPGQRQFEGRCLFAFLLDITQAQGAVGCIYERHK